MKPDILHSAQQLTDDLQSESSVNEYREAAILANDFYRRVFMSVIEFKGKPRFALDCAAHALGWSDLTGCDTQQALAEKHGYTKENARKLICHMQNLWRIPPTFGQRDQESRDNMREVRLNNRRKTK